MFGDEAAADRLNAARFDARSTSRWRCVGDAREGSAELGAPLGDWWADEAWTRPRGRGAAGCHAAIERRVAHRGDDEEPTYAQVIGAVNALATRTTTR